MIEPLIIKNRMTKEERVTLYKVALNRWGPTAQWIQTFEELGELMQSMSKFYRSPNKTTRTKLVDEIADVKIMLEQVQVLVEDISMEELSMDIMVDNQMQFKLKRLLKRLENG